MIIVFLVLLRMEDCGFLGLVFKFLIVLCLCYFVMVFGLILSFWFSVVVEVCDCCIVVWIVCVVVV